MTQVMEVIVVGCGASGVAALRRLHDLGIKCMGLEASNRIGGRIQTVEYGECAVDVGAAWCHGEVDNEVYKLANPLDLLGRPKPDHKWFVQSNGELVANELGEEIQSLLGDAVGKADKDNTRSISECVREAAKTEATLQKDPALTSAFVEWFERNNHVGGQTDPRQGKSLKGLEECWGCEGEFMLNWKGRGYKTILDVLLNRYPNPANEILVPILTNKEVESIKWKSSQAGPANPLVQVKCKDGSLYAAQSVIVTVSVEVLKKTHAQLFNPPLPEDKVTAINTLQMCVLDKIYIEFTTPWWPKSPASFTILWRNEDKAKFTGKESWVTEIYGFNTVEYQPNMLLAWIYGEGAKAMEKASKEDVKAGVEKLLDVVFRKEFDVTPVKFILRSQWASNAYTGGAYAYRSVATEQNGGSAQVLSQPLVYGEEDTRNFPIVCFAGEATSFHRYGAVHGAVEAGFREADRVLEGFQTLSRPASE